MQQEGAEFNPNEMFPEEIKNILTLPDNTHKNVNSFTPMSFNRGGAGNNFLGISPLTHKEAGSDENAGALSKKSGAVFSTSYPWSNQQSLSPAAFYGSQMKRQQLSPWSNNHLRFKASGNASPQSSRFSSVIGQSNRSLRTTTAQREIEERAPVIKILNTTDPSPISGAFASAAKFREGMSNQSKGISIPSQLLSNTNT